jgi:hypothetical protein
MDKVNIAPPAPRAPTRTEVTSTATTVLGTGDGGVYRFKVVPAAAFVSGTADEQDNTLWLSFSATPGATPATPVAGTTGWPLMMGQSETFTLGDGIKFMAISDTTTVSLVWCRLGDE